MSVTIYFAGPDVFSPDYEVHKQAVKRICRQYGYQPLLPADTEIQCHDKAELAQLIYQQNITYIQRADIVVANVAAFRGHEPDSGTVFEIGYAVALGKTVWCYNVPETALTAQIEHGQPGRDTSDYVIEDFGLPLNLMIASSCQRFEGNVFELIRQISF